MDVITRQQAIEDSLTRYFTGIACRNNHIAERNTKDKTCVECRRRITRQFGKRDREKNPHKNRQRCQDNYLKKKDEYKARARKWEQENSERSAELKRNWRRSEKGLAQSRNWVADNKEAHAGYAKDWKERHPELVAEYTGTRRATKLRATPLWLTSEDRAEIRGFYKEAKRLQHETSLKHHVDHIIPLQGKNVSGLHVPWNLQVLTENENAAKGNSFQV